MFDRCADGSELASFFQGGEGLLDGVEVGRVFGQWQHGVAMCFEQRLHLRFVVERRIIHDDKASRPQFRDQHLLHPGAHGVMGAAALEQHRCEPLFAALRHDEIGALAVVAADFTVD